MTEIDRFLHFLGSRYAKARTELDEVRIRAMELVLAACVTELHANPPVLRPSISDRPNISDDVLASYADDDEEFMATPDLDATSELDVESYLKDEMEWSEDPRPRRETASEPPPTSEVDLPSRREPSEPQDAPVREDETDDEPLTDATNWRSYSPEDGERGPEEPVRGAWEAPEN